MSITTFSKIKPQKIGKAPVVVLPLKDWLEIESIIEEHEALKSPAYLKSIRDARAEIKKGKIYEFYPGTGKFKAVRGR